MPIKHWIVSSINRLHGVVGRPDLEPRAREPSLGPRPESREGLAGPVHLGAYAPLIAAIRDELERFVTSELRLHLAIAERDRYLLTSIEVDCVDDADAAALLARFVREFTPEQIKRFLARDVVMALPNASAIDLSQFGGLNAARAHGDAVDTPSDYADLVAQLRDTAGGAAPRSFEVSLLGRWTDLGAQPVRGADVGVRTPLAGARIDIEIEDADGRRQVSLDAVVPNRRYTIGKGEACDLAVNGAYTSRRHCEIWLENGVWWASDAGSTNGIRIESARGVLGRAGASPKDGGAKGIIEIPPGAAIVLSAYASGKAADYPRVLLRQSRVNDAPNTPLAPSGRAATPVTPIAVQASDPASPMITVTMASGTRTVPLVRASLPLGVGRSRHQGLVIDWAHEGVSGHHVDLVRWVDDAVEVRVLGDNGVSVEGVGHAPGTTFRWRAGEAMTLGRASGQEPACILVLGSRS